MALHLAARPAATSCAPRPCSRPRCWRSTTSCSSPQFYGTYFFGKITILLYWFLQIAFLGGSRVAYRYFRYVRTQQHARDGHAVPTLVLGRAADAEVLLRAIESGAVTKVRPVGVLSPSMADRGQSIRGVPVLGDFEDIEQIVQRFRRGAACVLRG